MGGLKSAGNPVGLCSRGVVNLQQLEACTDGPEILIMSKKHRLISSLRDHSREILEVNGEGLCGHACVLSV